MVILVIMVNAEVKRPFLGQGSSIDIIFRNLFDKLGLTNANLQSYLEELIGFSIEKVHVDRFVTLHLTLRTKQLMRSVKVDFLVVNYPSAYYVILGKLVLNKIKAVISIALLIMNFIIDDGKVETIKADQILARRCYNDSIEISKKRKK